MAKESEKWLYFAGGGICGAAIALVVALSSDVLDKYKTKPFVIDERVPTKEESKACVDDSLKWASSLDSVLDGYHLIGSELTVVLQRQEEYLGFLPLRIIKGFLLLRSDSGKTLKVPYRCYPFNKGNGSSYVYMSSSDVITVLSDEELFELGKEYIEDVEEWRRVIGEPKKI